MAGVLTVVAALSGCGGSGPLEDAFGKCETEIEGALGESSNLKDFKASSFMALAEDGKTIDISTPEPVGTITISLTSSVATCVLDELDAPSSIVPKMAQTRALDGTQSDSWDDFEVSWTYHPDNGFNVIIETR